MIIERIRYTRTLDYNDGIQLFEAKDPIGGIYVAALLATGEDADTYLLVGCEPEQLRLFTNGGTDLRDLMKNSAIYGWYLADVTDFDEPLKVDVQHGDSIPDKYLPKPGLFTTGEEVDHEVTTRARERGHVVLQVTIDPPEAADEHRVRATTLSGLIDHVQKLTRYAAEQVSKESELEGGKLRRSRNAHELDAIELSRGSTIVTFQGAHGPDIDGESFLVKALEQLDSLFKKASTVDEARAALEQYDPKMATAYLKLINFLRIKDTGFSYTWAAPQSKRPSHQDLPLGRVQILSKELPRVLAAPISDYDQEEVILEGTLEMADEPKGRWRIRDYEQGVREGTVKEDGPSLSHLVIDAVYRFECLEERKPAGKTGSRRKSALNLKHITLLEKPALSNNSP